MGKLVEPYDCRSGLAEALWSSTDQPPLSSCRSRRTPTMVSAASRKNGSPVALYAAMGTLSTQPCCRGLPQEWMGPLT